MKTDIFITDSDFSNTDKSFHYLLGFQPTLGSMILNKNELIILLDSRYFEMTKNIDKENIKKIIGNKNLIINYINFEGGSEGLVNLIIETINEQEKGKVIIEGNIASIYSEKIKNGVDKNVEISEKLYFTDNRIKKTNLEKKYIKKAINIIEKTFLYIEKLAKKGELNGKTELEVRSIILNKIFEFGGTGESFDSIVAFGKNSSIPHHKTGETVIGDGPLLIDMGAIYKGYCSDFTRTIWIGDKLGEDYKKFKKIYKIVKQAHLNAFENAGENMNGMEIHDLTNNVIKSHGYEQYFTHGTGHGTGLDIHEKPFVNKHSKDLIENDMIFTIEPGIYFEGKFGIRLEDIVIMESGRLVKYGKVKL